MASKTEIKRFRSNLSDELDSAALYETLAGAERDTERKRVYAELAASERPCARLVRETARQRGECAHASGERKDADDARARARLRPGFCAQDGRRV